MTTKLIKLSDDLLVEVEMTEAPNQPKQISSATQKVNATIDEIKPLLLKAARPIVAVWEELNQELHIEQAEIELGLGFEAEGDLFIARGTANANLTVKLTLKPKV